MLAPVFTAQVSRRRTHGELRTCPLHSDAAEKHVVKTEFPGSAARWRSGAVTRGSITYASRHQGADRNVL